MRLDNVYFSGPDIDRLVSQKVDRSQQLLLRKRRDGEQRVSLSHEANSSATSELRKLRTIHMVGDAFLRTWHARARERKREKLRNNMYL